MTNSLVGDHKVAVADVVKGVLDGVTCLGPISQWIPCEKGGIKHVKYVRSTLMANLLVGDHKVAFADVD